MGSPMNDPGAPTLDRPKIPRGCFAVEDWNGEVLIFDPSAELEELCRVVVYAHDDLRVRIVGTYAPLAGRNEENFVRVRVDGVENENEHQEFDRDFVGIAKIVNVSCQS